MGQSFARSARAEEIESLNASFVLGRSLAGFADAQ
jgi:hypothetical protein